MHRSVGKGGRRAERTRDISRSVAVRISAAAATSRGDGIDEGAVPAVERPEIVEPGGIEHLEVRLRPRGRPPAREHPVELAEGDRLGYVDEVGGDVAAAAWAQAPRAIPAAWWSPVPLAALWTDRPASIAPRRSPNR